MLCCKRTKKLANTIKSFEESYPLADAFSISRGTKTSAEVVRVEVSDGEFSGQGECVPYARYGESVETVRDLISDLPNDIDRTGLQNALPAGAARNAVDCAFWDLEAKRTGKRVWQLAGLKQPKQLKTAYTIALDTPDKMQAAAEKQAFRPLLKTKLGTPEDIDRLEAVRNGAPLADIIVDANEGWKPKELQALMPTLNRVGVKLIEQPLPECNDEALLSADFEIPLCADESCHTLEGLDELAAKYQFVNVKLDKTGGLTEAMKVVDRARQLGLGIFIGCMVGTSLGIAPATLLAQSADYVDLDGPLLLSQDRPYGLLYDGSDVYPPRTELWG